MPKTEFCHLISFFFSELLFTKLTVTTSLTLTTQEHRLLMKILFLKI